MRTPSKWSSPVADAWSPSFSSSRPTLNPGVSAGTMNALIRALPSSVVPVRAATTYVPAWPALVMNRLPPSMTQSPEPSSARFAVVRRPPASRAGAGLGEPVAADDLAARHRHQELALLVVGAGEQDRAAAQRRVRRDDQPERAPDPADLLDRDRVGEGVHAGAAPLLRDGDAEPAHLAQLVDDAAGNRRSRSCSSTSGATSPSMYVTDGAAEQLVLGRQVEVHGPSMARGRCRAAPPTTLHRAPRRIVRRKRNECGQGECQAHEGIEPRGRRRGRPPTGAAEVSPIEAWGERCREASTASACAERSGNGPQAGTPSRRLRTCPGR